jgi:hypothetical protein
VLLGIFGSTDPALLLSEPVKPIVGMALRFFQSDLERIYIDLERGLIREGTYSNVLLVESRIHAAFAVVICYGLQRSILGSILITTS